MTRKSGLFSVWSVLKPDYERSIDCRDMRDAVFGHESNAITDEDLGV
jgi:hypothetical protein